MKDLLYVMLLEKTPIYKKINKQAVIRHVDNIKSLDNGGKLEICGVLRKSKNFAGMIIFKADSYKEAKEMCDNEPFVVDGFVTYSLMEMYVGNKENNYLLQ